MMLCLVVLCGVLAVSRWRHDAVLVGIETVLTMDVRLGYTHDVGELHPNWTEVARSTEDRPLHCTASKVHTSFTRALLPSAFH